MTDPNKLRPHELAHEVLQDTAMDQALDWLIAMQCPQPGQQAEFEAWLADDPAHVHAFAKAQAAWGARPCTAPPWRWPRHASPAPGAGSNPIGNHWPPPLCC